MRERKNQPHIIFQIYGASSLLSKSTAPVADHLGTLLVTVHSLSQEGTEASGVAHQAAICETHLRTEDLASVGTRERKKRAGSQGTGSQLRND